MERDILEKIAANQSISPPVGYPGRTKSSLVLPGFAAEHVKCATYGSTAQIYAKNDPRNIKTGATNL